MLLFVAVKRPWSHNEATAVLKYFQYKIIIKTVPNKEECLKCIDASKDALIHRKWRDIKYYVYNYIKKINKMQNAH